MTRIFNNLTRRSSVLLLLFLLAFSTIVLVSCKGDESFHSDIPETEEVEEEESEEEEEEETDTGEVSTENIYIPLEFADMDLYDSSSQWYYGRSEQSEHFIVFWDTEYEDEDPNSIYVPEAMRVDIEDLLEKAEEFYEMNITTLQFAETGVGKSKLDDTKMMIFIFYQSDWLATGSGYDNTIGALWVNPSTMQPVGSTIAHEIGHSFQYQVFSDLGGTTGYRYGFGGNGGNSFWEQCAQWQSYQSYPMEAFTSSNFDVYMENHHRHFLHEWHRYASYWLHYYWADKHGIDIIGKLWRNGESPEDPIQTYMRITGITDEQLNDEVYDAATKFVTWDLDAIRTNGENFIGQHEFSFDLQSDGSYQVAYSYCPGTTGYNVIPLNLPEAGTVISTEFTGLTDSDDFNPISDPSRAGWRYGYVALMSDGSRQYGEMNQGTTNTISYTVPSGCEKLWLVVTGAPTTYAQHPWDEDEENDEQWPYQVKFTNTDILGNISFDGTESPSDATLSFDVSFDASTTDYTGTTVALDATELSELAQAFVMQPSEASSEIGQSITFYGVESDGSLNATTTANGYGHWFDADGDVASYGTESVVFSEFDATNYTFTIGQYPDHNEAGDQYTIKQALVYEYEAGQSVQVTFEFNITIE